MKRIFIFIIIITANLTIFAQNPKKWKDVSVDDFNYRSADAKVNQVILFEYGNYYFNVWKEELKLFVEVHKRILIIDTIGGEKFNIEIEYMPYNDYDEFSNFQVYSYSIINNKVKKSKIRQNLVENVQIDEYKSKRVLSIDDIKPGTIIEYRYVLTTLSVLEPPRWYFQHDVPCLYSQVNIKLPNFISYTSSIVGEEFLTENISSPTYTNLDYVFHYEDPIPGGAYYRNKSFTKPVHFSLQSMNYSLKMRNIPAYTSPKYIDCSCNYIRNISLNLFRIDQKNGLSSQFDLFTWENLTQRLYQATEEDYVPTKKFNTSSINYPKGFIVYSVKTWAEVDENLKKHQNFGLQLLKGWNYSDELDKIITDTTADNLKNAIKIHNYVRDNYNFNGIKSIYTSNDLEKLVKTKNGNSADINFLMIYYMKKSGINAFPVIIRTVDMGKIDYLLPVTRQFNKVIAGAKINNNLYYFDATNKNYPWFVLNPNNLNCFGRAIGRQDTGFVEIKSSKKSFSNNYLRINFGGSDGNFLMVIKDFGQSAVNKRINYADFISDFNSRFKGLTNFEHSEKNINSVDDTLMSEISFMINNYLDISEIYPFDFFDINYEFNSPLRNEPVFFADTYKEIFTVDILLPSTMEVKSMPLDIRNEINGASLQASTMIFDNTLRLILQIDFDKRVFQPDEYVNLRYLMMKLDNFINTPVVFY